MSKVLKIITGQNYKWEIAVPMSIVNVLSDIYHPNEKNIKGLLIQPLRK